MYNITKMRWFSETILWLIVLCTVFCWQLGADSGVNVRLWSLRFTTQNGSHNLRMGFVWTTENDRAYGPTTLANCSYAEFGYPKAHCTHCICRNAYCAFRLLKSLKTYIIHPKSWLVWQVPCLFCACIPYWCIFIGSFAFRWAFPLFRRSHTLNINQII